MIWPFSILFEPIKEEIIETYTIEKKPNWEALSPLLADGFSIAGNILPSKKIAPPVGKLFLSAARIEDKSKFADSRVLKSVSDIKSIFVPGSKYEEEQYVEEFENGCEFTMNYKNMFMVVPSVVMYESDKEIIVKYFYKQGVKSLQYYWFGFCSVYLFLGITLGTLPILGFIFFNQDIKVTINGEIRNNDFLAYFSILFFMLSIAFLLVGMAIYFRKDLLNKARIKVREFLDVI